MRKAPGVLALLIGLACGGSPAPADLADADALAPDAPATPELPDAVDVFADATGDLPGEALADVPSDVVADAPVDAWTFDRDAYPTVHGWMLLDADRERITAGIEAAAAYGVNHVQLSHDLISEVDQLVGDGAAVQARVDLLNHAIGLAHQHGMKAYVWAHELSGVGFDVCYGPDGDLWTARAEAWRAAIARIPDVDGAVMMFGSAPVPPWFTICTCAWCPETDGDPFDVPPRAEKIRLITEHVGAVVVGELGKELIARVFVHEPEENAWHAEGFAAARGIPFTTMHKGPVQDWNPYNPPDPTVGACGPHPAIVEEDVAGEYYGRSVLPFCAPGYFRERLRYVWDRQGIGAVLRIERGSDRALGTPNEINLLAFRRLLQDPATPLGAIWDEFLQARYGLAPADPGHAALRQALADTYPIRLKSHFALGIWALDKGSDVPSGLVPGQLNDRGDMGKFDPAWQATWDRLDRPDRDTLLRLWQEGSEAVALADEALALALGPGGTGDAAAFDDLGRRLRHQWLAARAWRAADLLVFGHRARGQGVTDADVPGWMAWARQDLAWVRDELVAGGYAGVPAGSPGAIEGLLAASAGILPEGQAAVRPPAAPLPPIRVTATRPDGLDLRFPMPAGNVSLEWGAALPVLEASRAVVAGDVVQGEARVSLSGLPVGTRVFLRLRATVGGQEHVGGDFQAFLPAACGCAEGLRCVDGLCRACTPDCTGRCPGADDGCGGECVAGDCAGCCAGTACRTGLDGDLCGEGGAACIACGL